MEMKKAQKEYKEGMKEEEEENFTLSPTDEG